MSLSPGTPLGPYEVVAKLGEGGMGEVYRATDTRLHRDVAIKVLTAASAGSHDAQARFEREARAIAALNHPNICTLFDVGTAGGLTYLVMELLSGEPLHQALARGPWPLANLVDAATALADAVDSAHMRGIVHRDLKPANVFVTTHGHLKILDFGLAKAAGTADEATRPVEAALTGPGTAIGTLAYMSPEQLRGDAVDARTDLFSLGLVLYEMATGRRAFKGKTSAEVSAAILHTEPADPASLRPDLPPKFDDILLKTLEKDRDLRYQSAAELRADLKRLKRRSESAPPATTPTSAVSAAPVPVSTTVVAPPSSSDAALAAGLVRRHPVLLSVAAIVIAGAALAMWWNLGRDRAPTATSASAATPLSTVDLTLDGQARHPTIAPDGKFIAYVRNDGVHNSVVVKQLGSNSDVVILPPSNERNYWAPAVTPDDSFVDVVAVDRTSLRTSIIRVPFLGGTEQRIVDRPASGVGWAPDGRHMAFIRRETDTQTFRVIVADADGGNERTVYTCRRPEALSVINNAALPAARPAWSPDGRWIAVGGFTLSPERVRDSGDLIEIDAATGAIRATRRFDGFPNEVAYLDNDRLIVAIQSRTGPAAEWRLFPRTGADVSLTGDLTTIQSVRLTADRTAGVAERTTYRSSIVVAAAATGAVTELVSETAAVPGSGHMDGHGNLLYTQRDPSGAAVYRLASGARAGVVVTREATVAMPSPDGQIAIGQSADGKLVRISLDNGRTTPFVSDSIARANGFDPTGTTFLFSSEKLGHQQPWLAPLNGGAPRRLATAYLALSSFWISADGRQVIYRDVDKRSTELCGFPDFDHCRALTIVAGPFSADSRLAYAVNPTDPMNIIAQPIDGGPPSAVTHFTDKTIAGFSLSPDRMKLVITRATRESNVVLVKGMK